MRAHCAPRSGARTECHRAAARPPHPRSFPHLHPGWPREVTPNRLDEADAAGVPGKTRGAGATSPGVLQTVSCRAGALIHPERRRRGTLTDWANAGSPLLAAFLASLVEATEALTVVLAVGTVRGGGSALVGPALAMAILLVLPAALGPALQNVPLARLQLVVGVLLLLFGMRWLRKALLRAAGGVPWHDEQAVFSSETRSLSRAVRSMTLGLDATALAAAFKIVMLEGIEVVFIV